MVVAQLVNLFDPNLVFVLLLARLNAGRLPALDLTAEKLLAGSLMAQSLMDSKVGKLQSVEHFVSAVACEAFCADSACCVFSVSILVLQGASGCFYVAVENAALFLGNYASAAETVSLAAGTPAVAAGNWAAAAWAEFETENVELSLSHIHSLSQKDHRKKPQNISPGEEGGPGRFCSGSRRPPPRSRARPRRPPSASRSPPAASSSSPSLTLALKNHTTLTTGQSPGIDCMSLVACRSLIPFFLLPPSLAHIAAQCKSLHTAY